MGNRLSKSTIFNMSQSVRSAASMANNHLSRQSYTTANIARSTNISGAYANSFVGYLRNGINTALRATSSLTNQMNNTMMQILNACSAFERSGNGVIDEGVINSMCGKLSSMSQDVNGLQHEIDSALQAASKYISVTPVKLTSVASGYQKVISGLRKIIRDLHTLNNTITNYTNNFWGDINSVKGLIKNVSSCYTPDKGFDLSKIGSYISSNPTFKNLIDSSKKSWDNIYDWANKQWEIITNPRPYTLENFKNDVKNFNNKYIIPAGNNFGNWVRATVGPAGRDIRANTHVVYEDTGVWYNDSSGNHVLAGANIYYQPHNGSTKLGVDIKTFFIGPSGAGLVSENFYAKHSQTVKVGEANININANANLGGNWFGLGGKGVTPFAGGLSADGKATMSFKGQNISIGNFDQSYTLSSTMKNATLTPSSDIKILGKKWG